MEGKVEFWINDLIITDTAGGKDLMFGTKTSILGNLFLFAGIVSPSFGASVVSETAVTLQHSNAALNGCKEGYKIIPSLQGSTFGTYFYNTCTDGDLYSVRNDKPSDIIAKIGGFTASAAGITLQHSNATLDRCKEGYKIIPSLLGSTFGTYFYNTCTDGDLYSVRNDKPSDIIAKIGGFTASAAGITLQHSNATLDRCKEGYKIIPSLLGSTFGTYFYNTCTDGDLYSVRNDKPSDIIAKIGGFVASATAVTLCDDGYLNNGTCVAYDHFGIQPNHYNLALNSNQFLQTENDTCQSGYYKTNTLDLPVTVCMIAGTEVHLDWQGVDVTGTPAESCYYLGDLFAPSVEPASIPGLKFLGWRPMPE